MLDRGFEWFVAWRHLRGPDRGRQWTLKVGFLLIVLAVVGRVAVHYAGKRHGLGAMTDFPSFASFGRPRWIGHLETASAVAAGLGFLSLYLGLMFRYFTVFTAFSIFGVFLGTAAPILALSVMSGFEADLKGKMRGSKADIVITASDDDTIAHWRERMGRIRSMPDVVGAAAYLEAEVMVMAGRTPAGVFLRGIESDSADKVLELQKKLREGKLSALDAPVPPRTAPPADDDDVPSDPEDEEAADATASKPAIFLGEELYARTLRVFTGDDLDVMCPLCGIGPTGPMPKSRSFRVAGHFYTGMYEFDQKFAYASLSEIQRFLGTGDEITGIDVRVPAPELARGVAEAIAKDLGPTFLVRSWEELNKALFLALKLEKIAMFVALTFIVLVASFSIVSNLFMLVTEKGREVAILKSMGATDGGILRIFLTEGLYIGAIGTLTGFAVGVGACVLMDKVGLPLPTDIYYIEKLPIVMRWPEILGIGLMALSLSCVAAIYPAMLASRLRPVEGLRYE
ncbi:MAG: FtsX-like permease family protein [Deltaproteobacteria bacterium]|nr:FtsX-like permease family protein [Deltaproteobacteria bacterium]